MPLAFIALSLSALLFAAPVLPERMPEIPVEPLPAAAAPVAQKPSDRGRILFNRCRACHTLSSSEKKRLGPHLQNLFDRDAGALTTYQYSEALKSASFRWTPDRLDSWLKAPNAFLPGNRMSFAGMPAQKDREELIRYLQAATKKP